MEIRNLFEVFMIIEGQTAMVIDSLQTGHYLKTVNNCSQVSFALEVISIKKKSTCFNDWKHGPTVSDKPGKILRFITFSSYGLFNLSNASPTQNFFKILKQRRDAIK